MKRNEGTIDRIIRVVVGIVLLVVAAATGTWLLAIPGVAALATGALGFCGLYQLFGISTCPVEKPKS
jgi:membrane protein implicated in regulation of membrane protease activity